MNEYHKIPTVFKRDPANNYKTLLKEYATEEIGWLANNDWTFTEKVDGTNIRIIQNGIQDQVIHIRGRTDNAQLSPKLMQDLVSMIDGEALAEQFPDGVCLYGEGYGGKIQKMGPFYGKEQSFVLFDVKVGPWWLKRKDVHDVGKLLSLKVVPELGVGPLSDMEAVCREGFGSEWGDFPAEGIVARPKVELLDRAGQRIITKLKLKDFK